MKVSAEDLELKAPQEEPLLKKVQTYNEDPDEYEEEP